MLAIVIPYYKLIFFEATLDSLAAQTDQRFKVYIGDDASPESPNEVLEKFQQKFDFIYHRFKGNLGGTSLTKQWERCIALSSNEEWIMILGDDDVLGENVVEVFYANLLEIEKAKINVVRFASEVIDGGGKAISNVFKQPKLEKAVDAFWRKYIGETRSSLSEYIFSRKSFQMVKFKEYPLGWHSDAAAWFDFSDRKPIFSINDELIYVRVSNLSISGNQNNLEQKSNATFSFYYYLLSKKSNLFSENQKRELFSRISKSYLNDKKKINYFFKISIICFKNNDFHQYWNFLLSVFRSLKISLNKLKI